MKPQANILDRFFNMLDRFFNVTDWVLFSVLCLLTYNILIAGLYNEINRRLGDDPKKSIRFHISEAEELNKLPRDILADYGIDPADIAVNKDPDADFNAMLAEIVGSQSATKDSTQLDISTKETIQPDATASDDLEFDNILDEIIKNQSGYGEFLNRVDGSNNQEAPSAPAIKLIPQANAVEIFLMLLTYLGGLIFTYIIRGKVRVLPWR